MNVLGLDIGGANLKAAHSDGLAWSRPFALWSRPDDLRRELRTLYMQHEPPVDQIVATMTAELCDCFASKARGVAFVLDGLAAFADEWPVCVWSADGCFMSPADAKQRPLSVASANWHALATHLASVHPTDRSLLIDLGSTTCDIIPLSRGRCAAAGLTDYERLRTGELLYTGERRTPLMALAPHVEFNGDTVGVMAEHFATTADVYVLLGRLPPDSESTDTADRRPLTIEACARRVLRTVGADLDDLTIDDATRLARRFAEAQMQLIISAVAQRCADFEPARIIVSGSGEWLAADAARRVMPHLPLVRLSDTIGHAASTAACAYALVQLWDNHAE